MKQTNSRLLAWVLCMGMLSLTGCKRELPPALQPASQGGASLSTEGPSQPEELIPERGAELSFRTSDAEFAAAAAKLFEEKYGVKVHTEEGGLYDSQKIALEGPSGKGPDVFVSPHDKALESIQAGLFLKLDDQIVERLSDEVNPVALKTVTVDGGVYGVPVSIETNVMFYNKALVQGEPASTFEQIAEEAAAYNDPAANKFWYLMDVSQGSPIYPLLNVYGFNLFGPDGTDEDNPGFDTPEYEKGLEVLRRYHDLMPISAGDLANVDFLRHQFIDGQTAYLLGGPWDVKTFRDAGVDFGVTSLPTYDGKQQRPFAFVQNAHVSAYTQYPVAAQLFAEFLISSECAELLYAKAAKITSRADISTVAGLSDDEHLRRINEVFVNAVPMPSARRLSYYWTISSNVGQAVFNGEMTPAEGAQKSVEYWDAFLATE